LSGPTATNGRSPQFFASGGTRSVTCENDCPWSYDAATTGYHWLFFDRMYTA
jgi:hypothetical protein